MSGPAVSNRFQWRTTSDLIELIDTGTNRPVARITGEGRYYQWTRTTSTLLHGAPPASGEEGTLQGAKSAVLAGLPV